MCQGGALFLITVIKKPLAMPVCSETVHGDFFHLQSLNTLVIVSGKLMSVEIAVALWEMLDRSIALR